MPFELSSSDYIPVFRVYLCFSLWFLTEKALRLSYLKG